MREIKFRYWNWEKICEISDIWFFTDWTFIIDDLEIEENPDTIMQYTWLKDKNGKEIFESDIVKCDSWNPSTYKVWFDRWGFCFYNEWDTFYNDCKYLDKFEVIGNIYETPSLLWTTLNLNSKIKPIVSTKTGE